MKILSILGFLVGVVLGCAESNHNEYTFIDLKTPVKYFGYFGAGFRDAQCYPNCAATFKNRGNVLWLNSNDPNVITQSLSAAENHLHTVIAVQDVLFYNGTVRFNAETEFCAFHNALTVKPVSYYIYDEPYWNNPIAIDLFKKELEEAIRIVHTCAPGIPTSIIFAAPEVLMPEGFKEHVPKGLDWAGFDCYGYYSFCTVPVVQSLFQAFEGLDQKFIMVPDAVDIIPMNDSIVINRADVYKAWMPNNTVAIFPFVYQTVNGMIGAKDMPGVDDYYIDWYNDLRGENGQSN